MNILRKIFLSVVFCLLGIATFIACDPTQEAFQDRKSRDNSIDIKAYIAANKLTGSDSTLDGLFYIVKNINPKGQIPQVGDEITISYMARRLDGVLVDSNSNFIYIRAPFNSGSSYKFLPVPSIEELMYPGVEKFKEGDQVTLFVPWTLRNTGSGSLLAPLYIPLKYDIIIKNVRTEDEQIKDYFKAAKIIPTEIAKNGIHFTKTLVNKDSAAVKVGETVQTIYTGRFARSGGQFDAGVLNVALIDTVATATGGSVVKGFNAGIYRMRYGEKAVIGFPSALGYGTAGQGTTIPAYAPLVFEIQVLRIK